MQAEISQDTEVVDLAIVKTEVCEDPETTENVINKELVTAGSSRDSQVNSKDLVIDRSEDHSLSPSKATHQRGPTNAGEVIPRVSPVSSTLENVVYFGNNISSNG